MKIGAVLLILFSVKLGLAQSLEEKIRLMETTRKTLTLVQKGEGMPLLLLNGLDDSDHFSALWSQPLSRLIETGRPLYLFKWSTRDPLNLSRDRLITAIKSLLKDEQTLHILGYSVGGAIALLAQEKLSLALNSRLQLYTVASPIYGYEAPKIADLAAPFVGAARIEIGQGIRNRLTHKYRNCIQWITTNCRLDKHACKQGKTYPEMGIENNQDPLCSERRYFDNETHVSILDRAVREIVAE